jgi:hypothetical protein
LDKQQAVLAHVQTTVAHRVAPNQSIPVPTYTEFHAAIAAVHEVFGRYYTLLTHKTLMSFEPEPQYNEFEPFTKAWIEDAQTFDHKLCE